MNAQVGVTQPKKNKTKQNNESDAWEEEERGGGGWRGGGDGAVISLFNHPSQELARITPRRFSG
jgi:hypothetical protein